jgi:hypothetical protein
MAVTDQTVSVNGGVALGHRPARRRPVPPERERTELITSSRLALAALLALVAAGVATALCTAHTPELRPDSLKLAVPVSLSGPLARIGPDLHLGGLIALFTFMCLCYVALVRLGHDLSARVVVGAVVALHVLMVFGPPLLSTDVYSYAVYGRLSAVYHFNPYDYTPYAIKGDTWFPYVGAKWVLVPTAYGPVFTAMSNLLAHLSVSTATLVYKLIAAVSSLVAIAGVAKAAQRLGRDPVQATLFVGLNPVLIVFAVGGGHNDMLMLAALCWAVVALIDHRARTSGGLIVLAAAVKLTGAILLPFALAARREPARSHQWRMIVGGVLVLLGVGVISTVVFGAGPLHLLSTLEVIQSNGGRQSVPGFIAWGLGLGSLSHGVVIALQVMFVLTVVGLIVAIRRGRVDWITATGWAVVALLLTSTFLLPWYAVWVLPFAALSNSRALRIAAVALTGICMTSL